jgi:hypothetical protein
LKVKPSRKKIKLLKSWGEKVFNHSHLHRPSSRKSEHLVPLRSFIGK